MLLTISLAGAPDAPATDLGYLLHKNPHRSETQRFTLAFGTAHVFWPEVGEEQATAALLLDVDPVGLVRRPSGEGFALAQYVNDRPYVASSFLAVAIGEVYATALAGRCAARPTLIERPLPLTARLAAVPSREGEALIHRLFAPPGYTVTVLPQPLDERFPEWGMSPYFTVEIGAAVRLRDLLAHLTVLIPVLDGLKHYYVGDAEVEKHLRRGEGWLADHPERALIAARYLKHRPSLVRDAVARLAAIDAPTAAEPDGTPDSDATPHPTPPHADTETGAPGTLHQARLAAVVTTLKASGARRVLDLGCGEGRLLQLLLAEPQFAEIVGLDVSHRALDLAERRLRLDRLSPAERQRIRLLHGALTYRDARLRGFDAAAVVEVVEHLDPWRLETFARVLFGDARPSTVVLTTPNREYNARLSGVGPDGLRHPDHRFEWTRVEFRAWAEAIGARYGYQVTIEPVGPLDAEVGAPSQLGHFRQDVRR